MSYGYDGYDVGVGFFSLDGNITGQSDDGDRTLDAAGFYDISAMDCTVQGEVTYSNGVVVRFGGYLSEDQNSSVYAAQNSYGYFTNGTMERLAGRAARGRGSVGRISKPRLDFNSQVE